MIARATFWSCLVLKAFANNSITVGIEVGKTKRKGLNTYVIRKALTQALQFFANEVSNPNILNS